MKKYKASYTIEASVIMIITSLCITFIILVTMYCADCQTARNISVISGIKAEEKVYQYTDNNTGFLDVDKKINAPIYQLRYTGNYSSDELLKERLLFTDIKDNSFQQSFDKLKINVVLETDKSLGFFGTNTNISEELEHKNSAEIVRLINVIANGGM